MLRRLVTPFAVFYTVTFVAVLLALVFWSYQEIGLYLKNDKTVYDWIRDSQGLLAGALTGLLLFSAGFVAIGQLDSERRTRYANLLVTLSKEWNSDPYLRCRELIYAVAPLELSEEDQRTRITESMKAAEQDAHEYFALTKPLDFFEDLAFLIRKHYIPSEDVKRTFGAPMVTYYGLFEDYIPSNMRTQKGNEKAHEELEKVVTELRQHK